MSRISYNHFPVDSQHIVDISNVPYVGYFVWQDSLENLDIEKHSHNMWIHPAIFHPKMMLQQQNKKVAHTHTTIGRINKNSHCNI